MRRSACLLGLALAAVHITACDPMPLDEPYREVFHKDLDESSGLASSPGQSGRWYTHNDSGGAPEVFAFDLATGDITAYPVQGAAAEDWEDMAAGPCPGREERCLYIADFGDNAERRDSVQIYAVPIPDADNGVTVLASWDVTYPDGPRNAEALLVHPLDGDITIVTKSSDGRSDVLRVPADPGAVEARWVAGIVIEGNSKEDRLITGGDYRPDGERIVLRTYRAAYEWQVDRSDPDGHWAQPPVMFPLPLEKQGEAIAYLPDGRLLTSSEGQPMALNITVGPIVGTAASSKSPDRE